MVIFQFALKFGPNKGIIAQSSLSRTNFSDIVFVLYQVLTSHNLFHESCFIYNDIKVVDAVYAPKTESLLTQLAKRQSELSHHLMSVVCH